MINFATYTARVNCVGERLRDGISIDLNQGRVEMRSPDRTRILVKGANRDDGGSYTCELENKIGRGSSDAAIEVDVNCKFGFPIRSIQHKCYVKLA